MNSPRRSYPKKKASCEKRHMKWIAKSKERKGHCRKSKNLKIHSRRRSHAHRSLSRSHSRRMYYGLGPAATPISLGVTHQDKVTQAVATTAATRQRQASYDI